MQGIVSAVVEAVCECLLFFYAFLVLPPDMVIFLMSGVVFATAVYQTYKLGRYCGKRAEYEAMHRSDDNHVFRKLSKCKRCWLIGCNVIGGCLQIAGIIAIGVLMSLFFHINITKWSIGCVVCISLLFLSVVWSSGLQKLTFTSRQPSRPEQTEHNYTDSETARWKASKSYNYHTLTFEGRH